MKTCLGTLLLLPIIIAVIGTAVYHTSVNGDLKFEQRNTNEEYINTNRSYRPPQSRQNKGKANTPAPQAPAMEDDMVAEEAE